jgi:hypothetical protein
MMFHSFFMLRKTTNTTFLGIALATSFLLCKQLEIINPSRPWRQRQTEQYLYYEDTHNQRHTQQK